jgi:hypothetical protein
MTHIGQCKICHLELEFHTMDEITKCFYADTLMEKEEEIVE